MGDTLTLKDMRIVAALAFCALVTCSAYAGDAPSISPSAKDKCRVCGMFVAKYPDWTCCITFKGSPNVYFDGPKDMFTYLQNPGKYAAKQPTGSAIKVKDYYSLKTIDGRKAFYVAGGDVYGPMGRELVPFAKEADAKGFLADHKGNKVFRFDEVTPAVVRSLE